MSRTSVSMATAAHMQNSGIAKTNDSSREMQGEDYPKPHAGLKKDDNRQLPLTINKHFMVTDHNHENRVFIALLLPSNRTIRRPRMQLGQASLIVMFCKNCLLVVNKVMGVVL